MNWKRLLNLEQAEVLGLDIGSSAVKIVQLRSDDGGYAVTAAGIVDIADSTGDNNNRREINTVKAIRDCLQSMGVQTRLVVCGVCGPEVAVRYFKFPLLPPEEIDGAVLLEAVQVCPFNINDSTVDYQLIRVPEREKERAESPSNGNGNNNVSGVLVAATNEVIKRKSQLAKNALLDSVLMDVDGLALLNCFSKCEASTPQRLLSQTSVGANVGAIAVLNVGSSFTNLAIMTGTTGNNALPFVRDIAYAGNDIVRHIVGDNEYKIAHSGYEKLNVKRDTLNAELLAKACQKLIADVSDTLRYYAAQEKSSAVEKIFVCGGFALVDGFVELLDNQLPAAAVLWNPFDKMRCDAGPSCEDTLRENGPAMAVAAGLAMRSI